jgi:hypothetical protein
MATACERKEITMASFDYDVAIIGSGFGGSVAALRAAETIFGMVNTAIRPSDRITSRRPIFIIPMSWRPRCGRLASPWTGCTAWKAPAGFCRMWLTGWQIPSAGKP